MARPAHERAKIGRREFLAGAAGAWLAAHAPGVMEGARLIQNSAPSALFRRVALRTRKLDALREFYMSMLNLPVASDGAEQIAFDAGATRLEFIHDDAVESPLYHFAFNIPENQIESCMAWAEKRMELVINPGTGRKLVHFPNWNAHSIYFWDPSGNLVEFIARHTLRNARDGEFDSRRDVLCISEVGVVTRDVAGVDAKLTETLGLQRYVPPADGKLPNDFRAMGDENGLFIVVRRNRRWFMTAAGAQPFPAEVEVVCERQGEFALADTLCRVKSRA